jgi:type II secretory pathway pseudopilin PulG
MKKNSLVGFTLIEVLVILALVAILATLFIYFINPVELGKRNRDLQRIKDLKALELAINTYLTAESQPDLDGPYYDQTGLDEEYPSLYLSLPKEINLGFSTITDAYNHLLNIVQNASLTNLDNNNGEGWLPINLSNIKNILPALPVDPLNKFDPFDPLKNFFYTYAFRRETGEFEVNTNLESEKFKKGGINDQTSADGGSDQEIFEVGNNKCLIAFGSSGFKIYGTTTLSFCSVFNINPGLNFGNLSGQDLCSNRLFNYYPTRNFIFRNHNGDYLLISNYYLAAQSALYLSLFDHQFNFKLAKALLLNTTTPFNFNYIHQTNKGDYLLALSFNKPDFEASAVIKLDSNLNFQWANYYCHPTSCSAKEEIVYVVDDHQGNINLIRNTGSVSGFQLINLSSSTGEILGGNDYYYLIIFGRLYQGFQTNDGGFLFLGSEGYTSSPPAMFAKFNKQNKFEWKKSYLDFAFSDYYSNLPSKSIFLLQTKDGGYLFNALYDRNLNATSYFFVKTDYQGNLEWSKKYLGDFNKFNLRKIFEDQEGNLWLIVNSSSQNYLVYLDKNFNKMKEMKISALSATDTLIFNNFFQLEDKTFLLIGNFLDISPLLSKFFNRSFAQTGDNNKYPEEKPQLEARYYFNLIRFFDLKNLEYLKTNLFNITETNEINFATFTFTTTSDLGHFSTSTYNVTSTSLTITSQIIKPLSRVLVNQCDHYFSKNISPKTIIKKLIRIDNNQQYLAVGKLLGQVATQSYFWLGKISTSGDLLSSSTYVDNHAFLDRQLESVVYDNTSSQIIAVGNSQYIDIFKGILIKFDSNLNVMATKTIDFFYYRYQDIKISDNGNYVIVGQNMSLLPQVAFIANVNSSSLDIDNIGHYGTSTGIFNSLLINKDYFAGGRLDNQAFLVGVDPSLNLIWQKVYLLKPNVSEEIKKIILDVDGNLIALSNLFDPQDKKFKIVLRKINPEDGELIKEQLVTNNYFYGNDLILDHNNDYLITGYLPFDQQNDNFDNWSLGLLKVSKSFNLIWQKFYGGQSRKEISFGSSIVKDFRAGYFLAGYNANQKQAWVLKLSYNGDCLNCYQISWWEKFLASLKKSLANFFYLWSR